jgi:hypothetical protein
MHKMFKMAVMATLVGGATIAAGLSAQAQSVEIGHSAAIGGPGAMAAHADKLSAGVKDGNLVVGAGAADGVRVGDVSAQAGVNGTVSVPVPTPSRPVPVPTPAQLIQPITAPITILKKVLPF